MGAVICAEDVYWVKDAGHTRLVVERTGDSHVLYNTDAMVWDWLTLTYPYPKVVAMLAEALDVSPQEADERLCVFLAKLSEMGILADAESSTHG